MKHPKQPIEIVDGVERFKVNPIVRFIFGRSDLDLNKLSQIPFDLDDKKQFMQLLGYSVDGYNDLFPEEDHK